MLRRNFNRPYSTTFKFWKPTKIVWSSSQVCAVMFCFQWLRIWTMVSTECQPQYVFRWYVTSAYERFNRMSHLYEERARRGYGRELVEMRIWQVCVSWDWGWTTCTLSCSSPALPINLAFKIFLADGWYGVDIRETTITRGTNTSILQSWIVANSSFQSSGVTSPKVYVSDIR